MVKTNNKVLMSIVVTIAIIAIAIYGCLNIKFSQKEATFDDFSSGLQNILTTYKLGEDSAIFFDIATEVKMQNSRYYVDKDLYTHRTGDSLNEITNRIKLQNKAQENISQDNEKLTDDRTIEESQDEIVVTKDNMVDIDEVSDLFDYNVSIGDNKISLINKYQTRRLIVMSSKPVDTRNAIASTVFYNGYTIIQYASEEQAKSALLEYEKDSNVINVAPDGIVTCDDIEISNDMKTYLTGETDYLSWGADDMLVDDYTSYLQNTVGTNNLNQVVVAVLDTGIDTDHTKLANRIVNDGKNFSTSSSSSYYEYEDDNGHGTHVSGIICDLTLSNVKILPIKVLNNGGEGSVSSIISAIQYVINKKQNGMNIVAMNMSFGGADSVGSSIYNYYTTNITNAYYNGILSVVAAGNEGSNTINVAPAYVEKAITVSAINSLYDFASFSNYGNQVDVCAPGVNINSTYKNGGTAILNGTSMATPHVTAVVALLMSDGLNNYSISNVENLIYGNAIDLGDDGWDKYYGYGLAVASNNASIVFGVKDTYFSNTINVTLQTGYPNSTIYYTLDNSDPTNTNGYQYTNPISISTTTIIKAIVYSNNVAVSSVYSKQYIPGRQYSYLYYSNNGQIIRYKGNATSLVIPSTIEGITITSIGNKAFDSCTSLQSVTIPSTITTIGDYAFYSCTSLSNVTIQGSSVNVGDYAFANCGFSHITISNNINLVGTGIYAECQNLTSATFDSGVTSTGCDTFCFCKNLSNVTCNGNLNTIGKGSFGFCSALTSFTIPSSVTLIDDEAFLFCKSLTTITIPNSVTSLGEDVFYYSGITNVIFESNSQLTVLGDYTFENSNNLASITMPSNITSIGYATFRECTSLNNITIPNSVSSIDGYAFGYCSNLRDIVIPSNVKTISSSAFDGCSGIESISVDANNTKYDSRGNCNALIMTQSNTLLLGCKNTTIPTNIREISGSAFDGCVGLTTITIPNSVTYIDSYSFRNCTELTSITIPNSVVYIGYSAFDGCKELRSVIFMETSTLTNILGYTFKGCKKLNNLVVPNSVTHIGDYAFCGCTGLTNITMSNNIVNIGSNAFSNCTGLNGLTLYLPKIKHINEDAFNNVSNVTLYVGNDIISLGVKNITIHGYTNCKNINLANYCNNNACTFVPIGFGITTDLEDTYITKQTLSGPTLTITCGGTDINASWFAETGVDYEWFISDDTIIEHATSLSCSQNSYTISDTTQVSSKYYFVKVKTWGNGVIYSKIAHVIIKSNSFTFYANQLSNASYGVYYMANIGSIENGSGSYSYNITSTLPSGISFNNGVLSGTPTVVGTFTIYVAVTDTVKNKTANATLYLTIVPQEINIKIDDITQVYGETTIQPTYDIISGTVLSFNNLNVQLNVTRGTRVGTYTITGTWNNGCYNVVFQTGTYTIVKRPITITLQNQQKKFNEEFLINQNAYSISSEYSPAVVNNDNLGIMIYNTGDNSIGNHTLSGICSNTNYEVTFVNATYKILAGDMECTIQGYTGIYDGQYHWLSKCIIDARYNATIMFGLDGKAYNYSSAILRNEFKNYTGSAVKVYYKVTAENYNTYMGYCLIEIQQSKLIISIDDKTSVYGENIKGLTYTISSGNYYGDDLKIVLSKQGNNNAGSYDISASYNNINYNITFTGGNYTITPRNISIKIDDKQSNYLDNITTLTYGITAGQIVNNDELNIKLSTTATKISKIGEYEITGVCGNANYAVDFDKGQYVIVKSSTALYNESSNVLLEMGTDYNSNYELAINKEYTTNKVEIDKNNYNVLAFYDISINNDIDKFISEETSLVVKIVYDTSLYQNDFDVYNMTNDGTIKQIDAQVKDGCITFASNGANKIMLLAKDNSISNTDIIKYVLIGTGTFVLVAIVIMSILSSKKKKQRDIIDAIKMRYGK